VLVPQAHDGLVPKIFGEVDSDTRIPVKGSWIVFIVVAIPAFFMDLEAITKLISMGNLFMYSFVSCIGIELRYRDRNA
jgi:amino acid transporter